MLDTLAIARTLTDAGIDPKPADAITNAVPQAAEHGDPATMADPDAGHGRTPGTPGYDDLRRASYHDP